MARNRNRKSRHFAPAASIAGQVQVLKRWERWEDELICSLRAEGKTYRQISQRLPGRTQIACTSRAKKKHRTQNMLNYRKRWEDWEDQLVLVHREAGDGYDIISELLSHRTAAAMVQRRCLLLKPRTEASIAAPTATESQHRWTLREEQLLRFLRESGQSWTEIAQKFPDCTMIQCILHWYQQLPIPRTERWKEWEERLLVSGYYTGLSWREIAKSIPGRIESSARRHWGLQFCLPKQDKPWTSEELSIFKHLRAEGIGWDEINQTIPGHSLNACRTQWYKETEGIQGCRSRRPVNSWSAEETDTLIALYNTIGPRWEEISKHIPGRTANGCRARLHQKCTTEDGVGDAPSDYWIDYFKSKLHTRTTIPAPSSELTHQMSRYLAKLNQILQRLLLMVTSEILPQNA